MKKWILILTMLMLSAGTGAAQTPNVRSAEIVRMEGADYYLHTVVKGETFFSLSRLYDVPPARIESDNPSAESGLQAGAIIKILCREIPEPEMSWREMRRIFNEHVILQGETIYSIAQRYSIAVNVLLRDNPGLDLSKPSVGRRLRIRKSEAGKSSLQRIHAGIENYAAVLSSISVDYHYHAVRTGETLYSLSRRFDVSEADIKDNNDLGAGMLAGAILRIPIERHKGGNNRMDWQSDSYRSVRGADRSSGDSGTNRMTSRQSDSFVPYRAIGGEPDSGYGGRLFIPRLLGSETLDIAMLLPLSASGAARGTEGAASAGVAGRNSSGRDIESAAGMEGTGGAAGKNTGISASGSATAKNNFVEFYQGALLALEDIKGEGFNVKMNLYDTQRSAEKTRTMVEGRDFAGTDLVIGPVYEECLPPVMKFARERSIPVVSPLASLKHAYGEHLYQLTPSQEHKYDKLKEMFSDDKNIVFITSASDDAELEHEMTLLAGDLPFRKVAYNKSMSGDRFESQVVSAWKENLFVILSADESSVVDVLTALSSIRNNRLARSIRTGPISVIGHSRWMRYTRLDRNLLFKLNVSYTTNYHADRSNEKVAAFDRRYIAAFGRMPSLFSYRGYDAIKLFAGSMLSSFVMAAHMRNGVGLTDRLRHADTPLQSQYSFEHASGSNNTNTWWALVTYRNNYTVSVR